MTEPFRVAVVGAHGWSRDFYLPGLAAHPEARTVALCGRDRALAEAVASRFSIPHVYANWRAMLDREPLDAVAIVTPNYLHHPIATAALDGGLHVICDKPLALNAAEAHAMLERARTAQRCHLVMFDYRAMPAARRAKELIDEGYVGRVYHIAGIYQHSSYLDPHKPFAWRMSRAQAGTGTLGDLGSHIVDLARWWAGDIVRVIGHVTTFNRERPDPDTGAPVRVDADDAAAYIAELAGGAQAQFQVTKMAAGRGNYIRLEIYGSEGALVLDADPGQRENWTGTLLGAHPGEKNFTTLEIPARLTAGFETPDIQRSLASAFRVMFDPFLAAARTGAGAVPSNFADGLAVQEVLDAVARSAQTSQWERIS